MYNMIFVSDIHLRCIHVILYTVTWKVDLVTTYNTYDHFLLFLD